MNSNVYTFCGRRKEGKASKFDKLIKDLYLQFKAINDHKAIEDLKLIAPFTKLD